MESSAIYICVCVCVCVLRRIEILLAVLMIMLDSQFRNGNINWFMHWGCHHTSYMCFHHLWTIHIIFAVQSVPAYHFCSAVCTCIHSLLINYYESMHIYKFTNSWLFTWLRICFWYTKFKLWFFTLIHNLKVEKNELK